MKYSVVEWWQFPVMVAEHLTDPAFLRISEQAGRQYVN